MTLFLTEAQVEGLLDMKEVVAAVEETFRRQSNGEAVNSTRTRSKSSMGTLNVMHAALPYLGRAGLKCYMSSAGGTRFVVVLFDMETSAPLSVMGADNLGRYRTGAASGVATKFMYSRPSATLAILGSGRQAVTQVNAIAAVTSLVEVRVWSPQKAHRSDFARALRSAGYNASDFETPRSAVEGATVASTITASKEPFLDSGAVEGLSHLNICGGNNPDQAEVTAAAVGSFDIVAVDDVSQAKVEYGDLIQAVKAGTFSWESAVELKSVVAGTKKVSGRSLFKSGGAALEDVAVASLVYDKAIKTGGYESSTELT